MRLVINFIQIKCYGIAEYLYERHQHGYAKCQMDWNDVMEVEVELELKEFESLCTNCTNYEWRQQANENN